MTTEANNPAAGTPGETPEQVTAGLGSPQATEDPNREIVSDDDAAGGDKGTQDPPQLTAEETEEIERGGQKYRIPKALKDELLMRDDYTRKTQDLSVKAKALDTERETFAKSQASEREITKEGRVIAALDWQIEQLQAVDVIALQQSQDQAERDKATAIFWRLQQLQGEREKRSRELETKKGEANSTAERDRANRIEQSRTILARDVDGWNDDTANKAAAYLMSPAIGFTREELLSGLGDRFDHRIFKLAHLARVGLEAEAKLKAAAAQPRPQANPQPTPRVGGQGSPATRNPEKMSTEDWMDHRKAQLAKRRK